MRHSVLATLVFAAANAQAGSLGKLDQIDLIELEPKSARIQLLVVLDEDRVNTRQALKALYKKYNNYQDFIASGQAAMAAPNGSKSIRPIVVVVAPKDASRGEIQNIEGLKLAASKVGADVEVRPYIPALQIRPIPIPISSALRKADS